MLKNQKGQVALFVALIFQVLFVFFAMMINIGLLVHHKINLQNSVDLAAYYGATKQAETLNAIAHINYQIRQSWKLMTFRYRHLGSYGDDTYPGSKGNPNGDQSDAKGNLSPAFCINYTPFKFMQSNENLCRRSAQYGTYQLDHPQVPDSVGDTFLGLVGFQQGTIDAVNAVRTALNTSCRKNKALSLYGLTRFIWSYKLDIANRKELLLALANNLSKTTDDFQDLDGNTASEGIKNTLTKNLTYQNKDTLQQLKIFNSFADGGCGFKRDPVSVPGWLSEIDIFPVFWAYIGECNDDRTVFSPFPINTNSQDPILLRAVNEALTQNPPMGAFIKQALLEIREPTGNTPRANLRRSSMGFEKNPWCMGYVGVHAETKPQIPFSPFGHVVIKASAYAKPFGGTIGPWNRSQWVAGSSYSKGGQEVDPVSPPRIFPPDGWSDPKDPRLSPDHIRYIGDTIGTKSNMNMFHFAKALNVFNHGTLDLNWWNHLIDPQDNIEAIGSNGDVLAYGTDGDATHMRETEIASVAPDNFDNSYYSIEPDFYRNFYLRLQPQEKTFKFPVRGDIGQRKNDNNWKGFSIKDQIKMLNTGANTANHLPWMLVTFPELLTSFKTEAPDQQNMSPMQSFSAGIFGKCPDNAIIPDSEQNASKATSGNCIAGGRVGYSVKLVDGDYLNQQMTELGGPGTSGPIKNPPQDWASLPDKK